MIESRLSLSINRAYLKFIENDGVKKSFSSKRERRKWSASTIERRIWEKTFVKSFSVEENEIRSLSLICVENLVFVEARQTLWRRKTRQVFLFGKQSWFWFSSCRSIVLLGTTDNYSSISSKRNHRFLVEQLPRSFFIVFFFKVRKVFF